VHGRSPHGAAGLTPMLARHAVRPSQHGVAQGQLESHLLQHGVAVGQLESHLLQHGVDSGVPPPPAGNPSRGQVQVQAGLTMEVTVLQSQPVLRLHPCMEWHRQLQRSPQICDTVGVATRRRIPERVNASTGPARRGCMAAAVEAKETAQEAAKLFFHCCSERLSLQQQSCIRLTRGPEQGPLTKQVCNSSPA
jgi:hypothetical protein